MEIRRKYWRRERQHCHRPARCLPRPIQMDRKCTERSGLGGFASVGLTAIQQTTTIPQKSKSNSCLHVTFSDQLNCCQSCLYGCNVMCSINSYLPYFTPSSCHVSGLPRARGFSVFDRGDEIDLARMSTTNRNWRGRGMVAIDNPPVGLDSKKIS